MAERASLLEEAAALETLRTAWDRIAAKGARGGLDQVTVAEFGGHLERNLGALRQELLEERYIPEPLLRITVRKRPGTGERRILGLPIVRDKVAQEAVRLIIEPHLERLFLDCSYGYRPRKGPHRAILRVLRYLKDKGCEWVARADIDDFFGSLSQSLLLEALGTLISDPGILRLVELWIKMGTVDQRGRWRDVQSGVHQGAVISPILANLYLHPFDRHMTECGYNLVRYADDLILICPDRLAAQQGLSAATEFLESRLSLRLNPDSSPIASLDEGFAFLGIRFHRDGLSIDPEKLAKIHGKVEHITSQTPADAPAILQKLNEAAEGWRRYYGRLLVPAELERIDAVIAEAMSNLVHAGLTQGTWKCPREVEGAFQGLRTVRSRDSAEHRTWIGRIVREARRRPPEERASPKAPAGRIGVPRAIRLRHQQASRRYLQGSDLWVLTPGCSVGKTGERVVIRQDRRTVYEVPFFRLKGIHIAGHGVSISSDLISDCSERGIPILVLSPLGNLVARLDTGGGARGQIALRQLQALHDGQPAFDLAKRFVRGKVLNQVNLMKYLHKYHKRTNGPFSATFERYIEVTTQLAAELRSLALDGEYGLARSRLFSIEGRAAQGYWELVRLLLPTTVGFPGRERQGAKDLVNSLLNYGYAILRNLVTLAAARAGLTLQVSFLHALRDGEPTLVHDLIEEFRPQAVDRPILAMLSRGERLALDDKGLLTQETRRRLIGRIQQRLASLVHFRGHERSLAEVIEDQAQSLARHVLGEATYRPFVAKW